jgi:pimeloyl-ACP methyl ester carboxylesterase
VTRAVVLLHGLLGSARNLSTLARGLVEREPSLDVRALDLLGHGAAPPLPAGADSGTLAADALARARAQGGVPPLALVGHSLGGRIALRAAALEPAAVASVTLLDIAPGPLGPGGEVASVLDVLLAAPARFPTRGQARAHLVGAGLSAALADWLVLSVEPDGDAVRWRIDRAALAALHARITGEDLWPVVEAPRRWRARCIRGGASPYVNEHDARRLQAAGCEVLTIEGAGHFLHVDRPREVLDAVVGGLS